MLILVAHGSRDPKWRASVHALVEEVARRAPSQTVQVAFMQFDGPTLPEVVGDAVASGAGEIRLLPLFMASAGHVDKDIKPLVAELTRDHPHATLELLTPVGEDALFPSLIVDILNQPTQHR